MKIPFFYLEAGRLEIFQPQNTELLGYSLDNNTPIYSDGVLLIKSHGFPAFENRTLYLNGRQGSYSFNFLINRDNFYPLKQFIQMIKQHNQGND